MLHTSITLHPSVHTRLRITSKRQGKSISALVNELLDKVLATEERAKLGQVYKGLQELKGIGVKGVTDASTTVDETLYGDNGAWRGSDR